MVPREGALDALSGHPLGGGRVVRGSKVNNSDWPGNRPFGGR
jgi:hypothetical protein